ncbi:MAG: sulfite exporter TauE/SafE family protein [Planctomycetota bacterium]
MHVHSHELTLGLAFGLGALHALEPGHGKTAMLVYLTGQKRSFWHPVVMGVSSALAHSVSLVAIAAAVHLTHHLMSGDHDHENVAVTESLRWISAFLVLAVGAWMMWSAARAKPAHCCSCGGHEHQHCDDESHGLQSTRPKTSYSMSALLGVAFGLLPCPSALAAYFTGMSGGSPMAAYAVIGLFAAGIASSLALVGIVLQSFGTRWLSRPGRLKDLPWPHIRAGLILLIGVFYLGRLVWTA